LALNDLPPTLNLSHLDGRVELDVWSFNSEARQFYSKNGFKVFNERMAITIDEARL